MIRVPSSVNRSRTYERERRYTRRGMSRARLPATIWVARTVLALLGLLALSPPASADGAWVLWSQSTVNGRASYTRIDSFPRNVPGRPQVICARWAKTFSTKPEFKDVTFICLPDTVDPRGAKAKKTK